MLIFFMGRLYPDTPFTLLCTYPYFFFLPPFLPPLPAFFLSAFCALVYSFLLAAHWVSSCLYSSGSIALVAHTRMSIMCMCTRASLRIS